MTKKKLPELKTTTLQRADGTVAVFTHSSGNVFADLGFENAEELKFKTQLIFRIRSAIEARKMTQKEAAKLVGVDASRLSKMLRGEFDSFSTDKLFDVLGKLGRRIEVRVLDDVEESQAGLVLVA